MLSSIFDAVQSFHQAGLLVGATLLMGIATAILADFAHWRIAAREYAGEIVALRASRNRGKQAKKNRHRMYFPVIEYVAEDGRRIRAHTHSGSSRLGDRLPGARVRILVKPGEEDIARIKGLGHVVLGVAFAGFGLLLLAIALTQYRFSLWTIPCFVAIVGFVAFKLLLPGGTQVGAGTTRMDTARAWKRRKLLEVMEDCEQVDADEAHRLAAQQDRAARKAAPVFALFGLGVLVAGCYLGQGVLYLERQGTSAPGEVLRIESRQSQDSDGRRTTMYYPVVGFVSKAGQQIEFTSSFGSSSSSYRRGDRVDVLYDPTNPRDDVMIDRGIWNWAVPGGLALAGVVVFCLSLNSYLRARWRPRHADGRPPVATPVEVRHFHGA